MSYDGDRMQNSLSWMSWSWRAGSVAGIEFRISWTLFLSMVFSAISVIRSGRPDLIPWALVIPPAMVLMHTIGHLLMLRWVGGRTDQTLLWALGDMTPMHLALTPLKQFAVAAAGPAVSLILGAGFDWMLYHLTDSWHFSAHNLTGVPDTTVKSRMADWITFVLSYSSVQCSALFIWNLFPSMIFDGGRLWRAVLWPFTGVTLAVWITIGAGFVCSGLLLLTGFAAMSFTMVIFAVMMLYACISERRSMKQSAYDLVLQAEPRLLGRNRPNGILARWSAARKERQRAHEEVQEQQEQEVLDRLLAKVSEQGLPSLTTAERQALARISRQQKARTEAHSPF